MKMKLFIQTISALFLFGIFMPHASANENLAAIMRKMSGDFRGIGMQISNPDKNSATIVIAQDLFTQIQKAHEQVPDYVASLQGAEQDALLKEFQADIGALGDQVSLLINALQGNDNAGASAILTKISELKKAGHGKYDR